MNTPTDTSNPSTNNRWKARALVGAVGLIALIAVYRWEPVSQSIESEPVKEVSVIGADGKGPYVKVPDLSKEPVPSTIEEALKNAQEKPGQWVNGPGGRPLRVLSVKTIPPEKVRDQPQPGDLPLPPDMDSASPTSK